MTRLTQAAYCGETDMLHGLLNNGADIDALDDTGLTPLMYAAMQGLH